MLMLIGFLILVGVILWAVRSMSFVDAGMKQVIYILIVVATVVYLLRYFHMFPNNF